MRGKTRSEVQNAILASMEQGWVLKRGNFRYSWWLERQGYYGMETRKVSRRSAEALLGCNLIVQGERDFHRGDTYALVWTE